MHENFQSLVWGAPGHGAIADWADGRDSLGEPLYQEGQIGPAWRDAQGHHGSSDGTGASVPVDQLAAGLFGHGGSAVDGIGDGVKFVHGLG